MVILVVGIAAIGVAVFTGLDYLYDFAIGVYRAKITHDLDKAAGDSAKAITILGIQAVLAILFRGAKYPRTGRGAPIALGTPPKTPGIRYKLTVKQDSTYIAGEGFTSFWEISSFRLMALPVSAWRRFYTNCLPVSYA
ncbi:hypothetical protein [Methylocaldum marinum]|uniref:hypothetical protein n=1 Tax=Methylocaldum marinum TaxID=1432792 RepID=UPI0011AE5057|nr:hypothetical protein [Methylocaldum marinum]